MNIKHWYTECDLDNATAFVYRINFDDGTTYVGAKKIFDIHGKETNWRDYKSSSNKVKEKLETECKAEFIIIEACSDWETALQSEEAILREHDAVSNSNYLNMSLGGRAGAFTGKKHTEATKQKLREKNIGKSGYKHTQERKDKIGKAVKARGGTPHSETTKECLSELTKSRFADQEWRQKWYQSRHQSKPTIHTPKGVFNSAAEAASHFNISKQSVYNRCQSDRAKWSEWYKL